MKPFETAGEGVSAQAPAPAPMPSDAPAAPMMRVAPPPHTQTQSTLAPTSEYVRYLLLALPSRYIPRGIFGVLFERSPFKGSAFARKFETMMTPLRNAVTKVFKIADKQQAEHASALTYNAAMGIGSLALTTSYSWTVYKDIKNIFSEAVAEETGKPASDITLKDLQNSDNRMVQKTMQNFWKRTGKRVLTDLLFFPAAALRHDGLGDLMVGVKAGQAFAETWKRKTTMFEDLVTFVNNKINPRNGLGQAITVGEVFDLYQHYTETFTPERMFTNVLEQGTGEGARWAESQSIFLRLTELMNKTYAYKHSSVIDPKTGHAIHQAEFTLPKFIYLLGHDLIDPRAPKQTLVTIEVANQYGIGAVKDMQRMLKEGQSLDAAMARYSVTLPNLPEQVKEEERNGVIAKGSTMQLDAAEGVSAAPVSKINVDSILHSPAVHKAAPEVGV